MISTASRDIGSPEADDELWVVFQETQAAAVREKLFAHYVPFARNIAKRHYREQNRGDVELLELFQLAYAGLLESIDRYEPSRGVPFRPFAAYRISGSIRDGLSQMTEIREQISWQVEMRRERVRSLAVSEDGDETANALVRFAELAAGLAIGFMLEGTGLFSSEDGQDSHHPAPTAYESLAWSQTVAHLQAEFQLLPEREAMILRQHYLNGVNFDNIAIMLGITKGRISQIHRAALMRLRKKMYDRGHFRLEK